MIKRLIVVAILVWLALSVGIWMPVVIRMLRSV